MTEATHIRRNQNTEEPVSCFDYRAVCRLGHRHWSLKLTQAVNGPQ